MTGKLFVDGPVPHKGIRGRTRTTQHPGCSASWRLLALLALASSANDVLAAPIVTSFSPTSGAAGSVVTIQGMNFASTANENVVLIGGASGASMIVSEASSTQLTAIVPRNARTGTFVVHTAGGIGASTGSFTVGPIVENLSPNEARPGASVLIRGKNFGTTVAANSVSFNGTPATVIAANASELTANVPTGATSGTVEVSVNGIAGASIWPFEVIDSSPAIEGFSPGTGPEGTVVTLTGKNFGSTSSANAVTFGGVPAIVTAGSSTALTVSVPAGAVTGEIAVATAGQVATSTNRFFVATSGTSLLADGSSIHVATVAAGQFVDLTFNASAGDNLGLGISSVLQTPASSSKKPYVSVLQPDGAVLRTSTCASICAIDLTALPVAGTYTVRLFANAPTATVSAIAALSATRVTPLITSAPYTVLLDRIGQITRLQFDGVAGKAYMIGLLRSSDPTSGIRARIEVRRPSGSILTSEGAPINCTSSTCGGSIPLLNLPETGTYTLRIQQTDVPSQTLLATFSDATPIIVDGATVYASANFKHQIGLMSFSAAAGQRIDLGIIVPITANFQTNVYSPNKVSVKIYGPEGNLVAHVPVCESLTGSFNPWSFAEAGCAIALESIPVAGDYTVVIRQPSSYSYDGTTRFHVTASTPFVTSATIDGPPGTLHLNRPGQLGLVLFPGDAGRNVQFNGGTRFNSEIYYPLTAYKPDGSILSVLPAANAYGAIDLPTLPSSGTYVLEESAQGRKIYDRRLLLPISLTTLGSCAARAGAIATTPSISGVTPNPVIIDSTYTVTASVTPIVPVCGPPVGTVTINASGTTCAFDTTSATGCSLPATLDGPHTISVTFAPADPTMFSPSTNSEHDAVSVVKKSVAVSISDLTPEPSESGQPYSVQVQVAPVPPSTPAPTGQIMISDGLSGFCTFNLPTTTCNISSSTAGIRSVKANYYGDARFGAQSSLPVSHTVVLGAPTITNFTPTAGLVGTTVTINGTNFSSTPANNAVSFNGASATLSSATATRIVAYVPSGAATGPISVVVGGRVATSSANFTVAPPPAPIITSFTPASGPVGVPVTINGTNFSASAMANAVTFNGTVAPVTSATTTRLVANVPAGATTGRLRVMVSAQTGTSATDFVVTPPPGPSITGIVPTSGVVGIPITISGQGFNAASPAGNLVSFNGVSAFVTQSSTTQLIALVPQGATTGFVTVTVDGRSATSSSAFSVIPPGPGVADVSIISAHAEPSVVGQPFMVQVAVTPLEPSTPAPTGAVVVGYGSQGCLISLPSTTCTLAGSAEIGETTLHASYTGDAVYAADQSDGFVHITNPDVPTEICGFAPNTVPDDPGGFVPIGQLSGAVYSPGITRSIIGSWPLTVTITSPGANATISEGTVDVMGTFTGPLNTGITINGTPGHVLGGTFLVTDVPLVAGSNTLTATATTLPGPTATASVSIVQAQDEAPVALHAEQTIGMAPTTIAFNLDIGTLPAQAQIQNIEFDPDGDGVFDYTPTALEMLPLRIAFSTPGLYVASVRVTDTNNQFYLASQPILIRSAAAERGMLCDVYGYLKARLAAQDAMGAGSAYDATVRSRYVEAFTAIDASLPTVATQLGTIASGFIGPRYAEILVMRDNDDDTRSGFHVHMIHDADGVWRILGM